MTDYAKPIATFFAVRYNNNSKKKGWQRHARNHQNHEGWEFTGPDGTTTTVDLPHTWNARDGQDGGNDYWRGTCIYRTRFAAPQFNTASHQVWIQFDGVTPAPMWF